MYYTHVTNSDSYGLNRTKANNNLTYIMETFTFYSK